MILWYTSFFRCLLDIAHLNKFCHAFQNKLVYFQQGSHKQAPKENISFCDPKSNEMKNTHYLYIISDQQDIQQKILTIDNCSIENTEFQIKRMSISLSRCLLINCLLVGDGPGFHLHFFQCTWTGKYMTRLMVRYYRTVVLSGCMFLNTKNWKGKHIILILAVERVYVKLCSFVNISGLVLKNTGSSLIHFTDNLVNNVSFISSGIYILSLVFWNLYLTETSTLQHFLQ